jgi:hypothetical protein
MPFIVEMAGRKAGNATISGADPSLANSGHGASGFAEQHRLAVSHRGLRSLIKGPVKEMGCSPGYHRCDEYVQASLPIMPPRL